jgi:hypothetical protein
MSLDTDTAQRLARICGMFGSAHVGERANAAAMADKILHDLGVTWSDIIIPSDVAPARDWRVMAQYCNRFLRSLGDCEAAFVECMLEWRGVPSDKQQKWLSDIYARLCREVAA